MGKKIAIGVQGFDKLREGDYFYVDKTSFIKEWWESGDDVTLITRPRRFGKTLTMSMLENFFSIKYVNREDLFEGLSIWKEEAYQKLQGTYPVISLSFANIKESSYEMTRLKILQLIVNLYSEYEFLLYSDVLTELDKDFMRRVSVRMNDADATLAIYQLSKYLYQYYGKKVIILLDEYDTPMQEAYVHGYWNEMVSFIRSMFNSMFKTNPYLARAIMTGITRVSKESIFSDLNNLQVVTTTSDKYATVFGFTEEEVFNALEECHIGEEKAKVKQWYDGFVFGTQKDIYNPWSILNFLDKKTYGTYWANTSSNSLVGKLIREGSAKVKELMEHLLKGETICCEMDEQIVYNQLGKRESAIWSLLLASGYLKALSVEKIEEKMTGVWPNYELALTNREIQYMFLGMAKEWFGSVESDYNNFIKALLLGNLKAMNAYMNRVTVQTFSYFDTGKGPLGDEPERFYHGFVLGLLAALHGRYVITSNRESGFGRYDIMLEPKNKEDIAIILEFKIYDGDDEESLKDTVKVALAQIEEKQYEAVLLARGIERERIKKYGFAFQGRKVLIGCA